MDTYYTIEEKYLQAVDEITYGEAPKGLHLLNQIVNDDPFYARAHYQLGMIYYYQLKDYQTAGYHFKTCCEIEPAFPDVYYHYLHLVVFLEMEQKVNEIASKAISVCGVEVADIENLKGLFAVLKRKWTDALKFYKAAHTEATGKTQRNCIEESLERVKLKMQHSSVYQYHLAE